jgi:hypothetical protein
MVMSIEQIPQRLVIALQVGPNIGGIHVLPIFVGLAFMAFGVVLGYAAFLAAREAFRQYRIVRNKTRNPKR